MRNLLFILLLAFSNTLAAQPVLTKQETVNYIQKKLNEGVGHKSSYNKLMDADVRINDCSFTYNEVVNNDKTKPNYREDYNTYTFNILHIKSFVSVEDGDLSYLRINLTGKTGLIKSYTKQYNPKFKNQWVNDSRYDNGGYYDTKLDRYDFESTSTITRSTDFILIRYLKSDATNFNKLKKAFEHLHDLCKAEDDPFGE